MNSLIHLNVSFDGEKNENAGFGRSLKSKHNVDVKKIDQLIRELQLIKSFYHNNKVISGCLVDVVYDDIIAKSNRIKYFLRGVDNKDTNLFIVGARFTNEPEDIKTHIITYYLNEETIDLNINKLKSLKKLIISKFNGEVNCSNFNNPKLKINCETEIASNNVMRNIIVDISVIKNISIPQVDYVDYNGRSILLNFYNTEKTITEILLKIGIDGNLLDRITFYGNTTISVKDDIYRIILEKIPYLVSMTSCETSEIDLSSDEENEENKNIVISKPSNEPTIGVIDCLFEEKVYFHDWVDNNDYLDEVEKLTKQGPRDHGTSVTSIIVDGPTLNPWLDDGCGRFRVRHFGVCDRLISVTRLMDKIERIVKSNSDIHVWNLSLGTEDEISNNFISYDASILDRIQSENNCIFVVSGTNDKANKKKERIRIGSPADSLNSMVVNAVRKDGSSTSYSRIGPVLSFFNKPDISYYGGDYDQTINVINSKNKIIKEFGTSYAAPWISRKLCFLIDIMKLPREIAKAIILDSCQKYGESNEKKYQALVGYGVPPIKIEDILNSKNEELKFYIYGTTKDYKTSFYDIPIPKDEKGNYPYTAKATLCYFPTTSRNQGVDYTDRELSIQFGRVKEDNSIEDINKNTQEKKNERNTERASRKEFRKWENTKLIYKKTKSPRSLISYENKDWGICITSKNRFDNKKNENINFGVVVSMKEVNNNNRFNEFITLCNSKRISVDLINIDNKIDIYNTLSEDISIE